VNKLTLVISTFFSFELSWIRDDGFAEMIEKEWNSVVKGSNPIEIWQNKIRHLRHFFKGWVPNRSGRYKKRKKETVDYH
jgi:hypothetical protein